jgi:hypothetical protein
MTGFKIAVTMACGLTALGATTQLSSEALLQGLTEFRPSESRRASSSHEDLHKNGDARSIAKGETLVLGEFDGPGIITHMWSTVGSADPFHGRSLVFRIYWDGNEKPSVEAPLGDFFAQGHGKNVDVHSLPVGVNSLGRARNFYWRMPFHKSAKVTVTNESTEYDCDSFYYYLDWHKVDSLPADSLYFHARYRQEFPAQPGDYTILETEGKGYYAGTVQSVHQTEIGWFGEGDDRFYIDGEDFPSLRGTGTEDYFNDAWGYREFNQPFYGVSIFEGYMPGDRVTAYRWHLPDPIAFSKSLKVTIEHHGSVFGPDLQFYGQFHERADWVSSVAYWYQTPVAAFDGEWPSAADRLPPYRVLPAEELTVRATPETGLTKSEGVTYSPGTADAAIDFVFEVEEAGLYQINAYMMHSFLGGQYQPILNGNPIGAVRDFYIQGQDPVWQSFDLHQLEPGEHVLRFEGRGVNPAKRTLVPALHGLGMNYLILLRLEDLAGYQDTLKRLKEKQARKEQAEKERAEADSEQ